MAYTDAPGNSHVTTCAMHDSVTRHSHADTKNPGVVCVRERGRERHTQSVRETERDRESERAREKERETLAYTDAPGNSHVTTCKST